MGTDLKERPQADDEELSPLFGKDTPQSVYDDEFEKIAARMKSEESADGPAELENKEKSIGDESSDAPTAAEARESTSLGAQTEESTPEPSLYKNKGKAKGSLRDRYANRRNAMIFSAASTVVSGVVILTLQAPNILLNQLKEMLLNRISSVQMHHTRRYRQKKLSRLKNYLSKDGRMGQRIISEMEADGYTFRFDPNDSNKILGISHPDGTGIIGDGIGDHIDGYMEVKHPLRTARWKTKRMNAFYVKFGVSRSSVIGKDKARAGPDGEVDAKKTVNKEIASDVLEGEDVDLRGAEIPEDKENPSEEARRQEIESQSSDVGDEFKEAKEKLTKEGLDVSELEDDGLVKAASEAGDGITEDLVDSIDNIAAKQGVGSKMFNAFKSFANPLDIADRVCTVRNRLEGAVRLARIGKAIKLMRYAMVFINAADDARRGNGNGKLIAELGKRITAEDKNGLSIGASPGFAYMMKNRFSKSRNNATRTQVAVDGKLTGLLGGIREKINLVPGMSVGCPVAQNPIVQVGTGVASLVVGFFSGGTSTGIQQAFQQGFKQGVKEVVEGFVEKVLTKETLKTVLKGVAAELTFEAIMTMTEIYVQRSLNLPFTGQEKGGQLGDILTAGMGTSNKQRSLVSGMVPGTSSQVAQAQQEYIAWHKQELAKRSFPEKMLSMEDTNSLLFNMAFALPTSTGQFIQDSTQKTLSLASGVLNPAKALSSMTNLFSARASAAEEDLIAYDEIDAGGEKLATDPAGNLQVIMRQDIEDIDPDSNVDSLVASGDIDADTLEPKSDAFKKHIEECVDSPDLLTKIENREEDCLAKQDITKQFKAHLAYLDMRDSLEAEFFPGEINSGGGGAPAPDLGAPATVGNNKIFVIGDSLTVGMKAPGAGGKDLSKALTEKGWAPTDILAVGGKDLRWGLEQLKANTDKYKDAGAILIGLGTNNIGDAVTGSGCAAQPTANGAATAEGLMKSIVDQVKSVNPSIKIYWTDFYGKGCLTTKYGSFNLETAFNTVLNPTLQKVASANGITVLPWSTSELAKTIPNNDVHPSGRYALMVEFIVNALGAPNTLGKAEASPTKTLAQNVEQHHDARHSQTNILNGLGSIVNRSSPLRMLGIGL